jgi:hypothetical protein
MQTGYMQMCAFEPAVDSRIVDNLILRANRLALVGGCPEQVVVIVKLRERDGCAQQQASPLPQLDVRLSTFDCTADGDHKSMALLLRGGRLQVPTRGWFIRTEVTKNSDVQRAMEGHLPIA